MNSLLLMSIVIVYWCGAAINAQTCTELENCGSCSNPDVMCTSCSAGYGMRFDPYEGCEACPANCISCDQQTSSTADMTCYLCAFGYEMDEEGQCEPCPPNCYECEMSEDGMTTLCLECDIGYGLTSTQTCALCPSNCLECSVDSTGFVTTCTLCNVGYILNLNDATPDCLSCPSECQACTGIPAQTSQTRSQCSSSGCIPNYYYNTGTGLCDVCQVSGCVICGDDGTTCSQCDSGYRPVGDTTCSPCTENRCDTCPLNALNTEECTLCYTGYTLTGGVDVCKSCPSNCEVCSESGGVFTCSVCSAGYGLSGGLCKACSANCADCASNADDCATCDPGYAKATGTTTCTSCGANCESCSIPGTCDTCAPGYRGNVGACEICTATNCRTCTVQVDQCDGCYEGDHVDANNNCVACSGTLCNTCAAATPQTCSGCRTGAYGQDTVNTDNCAACTDSACLDCAADYTICTTCPTANYILNAGICEECPVNCNTCTYNGGLSTTVCTVCDAGYALGADVCNVCPTNCATCTYDTGLSATVCDTCVSGYELVGDVCMACPAGCSACTANEAGILECNTCATFYGLEQGRECTACPSFCTTCALMNGETICSQCNDGYALKSDGTCTPCMTGCSLCSYSGEALRCSLCDAGYAQAYDRSSCVGCTVATGISNCGECTDLDSALESNCTMCVGGYTFKDDDHMAECIACSQLTGCASCRDRQTICDEDACANGYRLDDEGRCAYFCHECGSGSYLDESICGLRATEANYSTSTCPYGSCWVERITTPSSVAGISDTVTYRRGCRSDVCTEFYQQDQCTTDVNGVQECRRCCVGDLCNDYVIDSASGHVISAILFLTTGLVSSLLVLS